MAKFISLACFLALAVNLLACSAFVPLPLHLGQPSSRRHRTASSTFQQPRCRRLVVTRAQNNEENDESEASTSADDASSSSWLLTLILPLWLVYISNQWSRSSIYYLVDFSNDANPFQAMNVDIGFTEGQYGLLASVVFTSLFAIASLGAGVASDRYNRKFLTIASAVTWSLATFGTAVSDSYTQVVICRILMGLACAFSTPTAYTLIKEGVPEDRVSLSTSLYSTAVALGSGLASLTLLLDEELGWRNALVAVSLFGATSVAASVLLLPDDPKDTTTAALVSDDAKNETESPSILSDVTEVVSTSRVQWLFLGSFLRFCSGLCIGVWSAPYYRMVFADHLSDYAVAQAAISAVGASASGLLGGATADWLSANAAEDDDDKVGRQLWVPVVGSLLAAPTWYFAVNSEQSFETAMAWLAAEYFVAECWFGPTISTLQSTVGPKIGGTAQGLFTLTGAVANFAPSVLGFLYGQASGSGEDAAELSGLLAAGVCFGYISSAVCFFLASQSPPPTDKAKLL